MRLNCWYIELGSSDGRCSEPPAIEGTAAIVVIVIVVIAIVANAPRGS